MKFKITLAALGFLAINLHAQAWEPLNPEFPNLSQPDFVYAANENDLWTFGYEIAYDSVGRYYFVTGYNYALSRSTDGGESWQSLDFPHTEPGYLSNIAARDGNTAWIGYAGDGGDNHLLKTTDGGQNWTDHPIDISTFINVVHFYDDVNGFTMSDPDQDGFVIHTTSDGGDTWSRVDAANIPGNLTDEYGYAGIYEAVGSRVWFGTSLNRIYYSADLGHTWSLIPAPIFNGVYSMVAADNAYVYNTLTTLNPSDGYPLTTLYRTSDSGLSWQQPTPTFDGWWIADIELVPGTETIIAEFNREYLVAPTETRISYDHGSTWITIDDVSRIRILEFLDAETGFAGSWQPLDDPSSPVVYRYNGSALTGLFDPKPLDIDLSLSPNPTVDFIDITLKGDVPEDYLILLNDLSGRLLARHEYSSVQEIQERIDLKSLSAGTYTMTIASKDGVRTEKVIKL